MLIRTTELGVKDNARLYALQAPGFQGAVSLSRVRARGYNEPDRIEVALIGTQYGREYAMPEGGVIGVPHIDDLPDGYNTLAAFVATWQYATDEQRIGLWLYDQEITYNIWGNATGTRKRTGMRVRAKWATWRTEDRPRQVKAAQIDATWHRLYVKDLKTALKGTKAAVRIGSVTIKPSVIKDLCATIGTETIDLADAGGALQIRSVDQVKRDGMKTIGHRTQCTLKHGAGDPYAGRNGFEARIVLAA